MAAADPREFDEFEGDGSPQDPDRPDEPPRFERIDPPEDDYSTFEDPVASGSQSGLPLTPPPKTIAFALRTAVQLQHARERLRKKAGGKSSADLAADMGYSPDRPPALSAEADQAATAAVHAGFDDMFSNGTSSDPADGDPGDSLVQPKPDNVPSSPAPTRSLECTGNVPDDPTPPATVMAPVMPAASPGQPPRDYFKDLDTLL